MCIIVKGWGLRYGFVFMEKGEKYRVIIMLGRSIVRRRWRGVLGML